MPGGRRNAQERYCREALSEPNDVRRRGEIDGSEVHRIDSETGVDGFTGSMRYVLEGAYQKHEQFKHWRRENALESANLN